MTELIDMELGVYSISCQFKNNEDNFIGMFLRMYTSVQNDESKDFGPELCDIRGPWNYLRCIDGDFDIVHFLKQKRNCLRSSTTRWSFFNFHWGTFS